MHYALLKETSELRLFVIFASLFRIIEKQVDLNEVSLGISMNYMYQLIFCCVMLTTKDFEVVDHGLRHTLLPASLSSPSKWRFRSRILQNVFYASVDNTKRMLPTQFGNKSVVHLVKFGNSWYFSKSLMNISFSIVL